MPSKRLRGHVKGVTAHVTRATYVTRNPGHPSADFGRVVDVDNWLGAMSPSRLHIAWTEAMNLMVENPDLSFLQSLEIVRRWEDEDA